MPGFLAYIMPLETGLHPDQGLPGQPPGIWPSPGYPTHPIAPGGGPSQGPGFPTHPIAPGGPPPGIWPSPGWPSHPIAPGGQPPGIWPSPGQPTPPIYIPVEPPPDSGLSPEHPIYIPVYPDQGLPPVVDMPPDRKQKLIEFLTGNLPPNQGPPQPTPVQQKK